MYIWIRVIYGICISKTLSKREKRNRGHMKQILILFNQDDRYMRIHYYMLSKV